MNNFVVLATGAYGLNDSAAPVLTIDLVNTLAKGSIAFFDQDSGSVIDQEADITSSTKRIILAYRDAAMDTLRVTSPIVRKNLRAFIRPYVNGSVKRMCLGSNTDGGVTYGLHIAPTILAGDEYGVLITNIDLPIGHNDREVSCMYIAGYGETQETVVKGLVAQVNANSKAAATALISDPTNYNGISFQSKVDTSLNKAYNFSVSPLEMLRDADILEFQNVIRTNSPGTTAGPNLTLTTGLYRYNEGSGNSYQVINELKDAWAKAGWGNSHVENVPTSNFVHNISKISFFHTIVLEFKPDFISGQDLGNEMHFTQTVMIFVPTTNPTVWTLLQSLVNAYAA